MLEKEQKFFKFSIKFSCSSKHYSVIVSTRTAFFKCHAYFTNHLRIRIHDNARSPNIFVDCGCTVVQKTRNFQKKRSGQRHPSINAPSSSSKTIGKCQTRLKTVCASGFPLPPGQVNSLFRYS